MTTGRRLGLVTLATAIYAALWTYPLLKHDFRPTPDLLALVGAAVIAAILARETEVRGTRLVGWALGGVALFLLLEFVCIFVFFVWAWS